MKRFWVGMCVLCLLLAGLARQTSAARGEAQDTYELVQSNIGPGGSGSSGAYEVSSTAGQPDVGQGEAGSYSLGGGFWGGGEIVVIIARSLLYLPVLIR